MKDTTLTIRLSRENKEALARAASADDRAMSAYVERLIVAALKSAAPIKKRQQREAQ